MPRHAAARLPGAPAETPDADGLADQPTADSDAPAAEPSLPPDVAALVAREVARQMRKQQRTAEVVTRAEAELPDQRDIDPAKITSPTLTKQGYVVPLNYGEPNPRIADQLRRG